MQSIVKYSSCKTQNCLILKNTLLLSAGFKAPTACYHHLQSRVSIHCTQLHNTIKGVFTELHGAIQKSG